jgi:hypothetical protein
MFRRNLRENFGLLAGTKTEIILAGTKTEITEILVIWQEPKPKSLKFSDFSTRRN